MFTFEYTYSDYELMQREIAEKMHTQMREHWLHIPRVYAEGYMRNLKLPNGLSVNIYNFRLNQDWIMHRKKSTEEFYTLRFDVFDTPKEVAVGIDQDVIERRKGSASVAYLTSSLLDWSYRGTTGTKVKGVNIILTPQWLGKMLGIELYEHVMPVYLSLRSRSYNMEPLDSYYKELMDQIFNEHPDTPFPKLYVMNRVQLLMERFFKRIQKRVSFADVEQEFKQEDLQQIFRVEEELFRDFSAKLPSIEIMARNAAMSSTKFKNLFKSVYGLPVYEYYQKKRMQQAAVLLAENEFSIKQIGQHLGYSNIGNFALAFKKQYLMLPQEYRNEILKPRSL